jgi:hypothetical protein
MVPIIRIHNGIHVVREDLFPGGTKARFIWSYFDGTDELVYATPAEGGAQYAMAHVASLLRKRVTLFTARRANPHPRTTQVARMGAKVVPVYPGYLSTVRARAQTYAALSGARLVPFGADLPEARATIAAAARCIDIEPDEVWCAAGSGVLARALAAAWPKAERHAVQVGRTLSSRDVAGATIHVWPKPFGVPHGGRTPFPSDPHYDAKAWAVCQQQKRPAGRAVLFWNVTGPAC